MIAPLTRLNAEVYVALPLRCADDLALWACLRGRDGVPSVELLSVTRLADTPHASSAPHELCDHDGKASGRLVLEDGGIRVEVVCSCGRVIAFLGRLEYRRGH